MNKSNDSEQVEALAHGFLHRNCEGTEQLRIKYEEGKESTMEKTMEKIVALAKSRGFVYPGSEIYGGLANTWDYGNLGVELKNNVKQAWWKKFVTENPYNVGVDLSLIHI